MKFKVTFIKTTEEIIESDNIDMACKLAQEVAKKKKLMVIKVEPFTKSKNI